MGNVVLGDSIAAGLGEATTPWPQWPDLALEDLVDLSIAGIRTGWYVDNLSYWVPHILPGDTVHLSIGTNDVTNGEQGDYAGHLQTLHSLVDGAGARLVIHHSPNRFVGSPPNPRSPALSTELHQALLNEQRSLDLEMCATTTARCGADFYDLTTADPGLLFDGVHLSQFGAEEAAAEVVPEPATALLLLVGSLMVWWLARHRPQTTAANQQLRLIRPAQDGVQPCEAALAVGDA